MKCSTKKYSSVPKYKTFLELLLKKGLVALSPTNSTMQSTGFSKPRSYNTKVSYQKICEDWTSLILVIKSWGPARPAKCDELIQNDFFFFCGNELQALNSSYVLDVDTQKLEVGCGLHPYLKYLWKSPKKPLKWSFVAVTRSKERKRS